MIAAGSRAAEIAILWFKALGVQAVAVSGPGSTEVYRDFRNPAEFEGVLQPLWRDRGDVLYSVGASASLAHVVAASDLVTRTPINGIDVDAASPLRCRARKSKVSSRPVRLDEPALGENPNKPAAQHRHFHSDLLERWMARANQRPHRPVLKDGLGFMYFVPNTAGPAAISIDYDGGVERIVVHWISSVTLALLGLACVRDWLRRRRGPLSQ